MQRLSTCSHSPSTWRHPQARGSALLLICCVTLASRVPSLNPAALSVGERVPTGDILSESWSKEGCASAKVNLTVLALFGLSRKRFIASPSKAGSDLGRWLGSAV